MVISEHARTTILHTVACSLPISPVSGYRWQTMEYLAAANYATIKQWRLGLGPPEIPQVLGINSEAS